MNLLFSKEFLYYCIRFAIVFCVFYFGTQLIIGLSTKGNYYSSFIHNYLDYVALLRKSLLYASKYAISFLGYKSDVLATYFLKIQNGSRVKVVYSCNGIGVFSFWIAFIVANSGRVLRKLLWITAGCLIIWMINVCRISLLIISANEKWSSPIHISHHTWFNIAAYLAIFIMIFFYDRSQKRFELNSSH